MVVAVIETPIRFRGAAWDLYQSLIDFKSARRVREILVEGPRGSGKSRPILQMIAALVENFPNLRVLICSKTRDMLTATILPEWELCWPADHPILSGPQPNSRSVYYHPNKSAVTIGGVMDSDRHYGASWDIVYADEAHKLTLDEWEKFLGTLRNWKLPNQQLIIASTNPKHPKHWLNERANRGLMERYKSKLADNPKWVGANGQRTEQGAAFISNLEKMGGVRLRRDVRGEWCANEGMILEEWEDDLHLVTLNQVEKRGSSHWLHIRGWKKPFEVDNYFVSMDFGYRAAGVLGVWAEDPDGRLIRCASVYHADKQLDWWADRLIELHVKWPFSDGVGDCAEPRTIDFLNDRLRWLRSGDVFIRPAEKTRGKLFGIDQLRWGLSKKDGGPRTYFINDGPIDYKPFPFGKSEKLAEQGHATCFEEEVMGYVWDDFEDPKPGAEKRERPDKGCDDHEIDETIYAHVYAWKRRMKKMGGNNPIFKPGTMGAWLGDDKILGADWNYGQPMVRT